MDHYVGIDLDSTNNYIAIIDIDNKKVFKKKTKNDLRLVVEALKPYLEQITGEMRKPARRTRRMIYSLMIKDIALVLAIRFLYHTPAHR